MRLLSTDLAAGRQGICSTSYREAKCHLGRGPHHFAGRQQTSCWPRGRSAAASVVTASNDQDSGLLAQWPARKQVRPLAESIAAVGLGSWRLRGRMSAPFERLAAVIEGSWREAFEMELSLHSLPEDLKFADSMDANRSLGIWSYLDIADPAKGQEGYPRLLIENRAYCSKVFRKLHLELAHRQDGMQVMHCVLYPRLEYDLPILSLDMVGNADGKVSLAIVDPCPCVMDRRIPLLYQETARQLQEKHGLQNNRKIPEWGQDIFSDMCVIMRPESPDELQRFMLYCIDLHRVHLYLSGRVQPLTEQSDAEQKMETVRAAHARYCEKQQENSKTSRVLQSAFGEEFANRYMSEVMFDAPGQPQAEAAAPP